MRSLPRRLARVLVPSALVAVVFLVAGPASAHIDADPLAAQAGTRATISFTVEHGCDNSPTTSLAFRIPTGVTNVKAVDKAGWHAALNSDVLTFSGGSQDAHTETQFAMTMTLPATAGTIYFPIVQTCASGSVNWIEIPQAGQPEPDHPAAALKVTAGVPTADDLAPADDKSDDSAHDSDSHTGLIVGIVIAAVVVVSAVGGFVLVRRRRA